MRLFVFISALLGASFGYIYEYDHEKLKVGHLEYRRVGMYTKKDAPAMGPPGNGHSFIDINVSFDRSTSALEGTLQVILSHSSTVKELGYRDYLESRHFCCTQDILNLQVEGCTESSQIGKAIVPATSPAIKTIDVTWAPNEKTVQTNQNLEITESGRYYLLFASCLDSTGDVEMTGQIAWMNPYGYLPGELFPFVTMFGWLAVTYATILGVWVFLCIIFRADLLQLQHYITVVIILGFFETVVWWWSYDHLNTTGIRSFTPVIIGVLLSSVKKTLSRILVLVVCMGYGVVKPSLTPLQKRKVIILGCVYLVFSSLADIISAYSQTTQAVQRLRAFFHLPVAALDSLFLLWNLQEIQFNVQKLSQRDQGAKLLVFRRFWQICIVATVCSVCWALYQIYISVKVEEDQRWETLWTFEGAWHGTYLLVLLAIAFLWRPSTHTTLYAYSEQLRMQDDEEMDDATAVRPSSKAMEPAFTVGGEDPSDEE